MSEISKTSSSLSFRAYNAQTTCLVSSPSPHADGFHLSPLQGHPLPLHCLRTPFHRAETRVGEQRAAPHSLGLPLGLVSYLMLPRGPRPGGTWLVASLSWSCRSTGALPGHRRWGVPALRPTDLLSPLPSLPISPSRPLIGGGGNLALFIAVTLPFFPFTSSANPPGSPKKGLQERRGPARAGPQGWCGRARKGDGLKAEATGSGG